MSIQVGDAAPDFTFKMKNGSTTSLKALTKEKAVVVYFYPADDTPGCTAEACSFRDSYQAFTDAGAEVIGISSDSAKSHDEFSAKHRLPFTLVPDEDGSLRKKFEVPRSFLGMFPGRVTYVIDRKGIIRHIFDSQLNAKRHISEALTIIAQLKNER